MENEGKYFVARHGAELIVSVLILFLSPFYGC